LDIFDGSCASGLQRTLRPVVPVLDRFAKYFGQKWPANFEKNGQYAQIIHGTMETKTGGN
jgi:hypothetical protein